MTDVSYFRSEPLFALNVLTIKADEGYKVAGADNRRQLGGCKDQEFVDACLKRAVSSVGESVIR